MRWSSIEHSYNLSRHLIPFMQDVPFYAEMSRHIHKHFTYDVPTAAVAFDPKADELIMWVNPAFMGGGEYVRKDRNGKDVIIKETGLTNWETRGVLTHEFNHLVFGHLNVRRHDPADDWNIATDLAINSMIVKNHGNSRDLDHGVPTGPLPKIALVPGTRPWVDPARFEALTPERKKAIEHFSDLIEKMPTEKASEWYFQQLQEDRKKNPDKYPGEGQDPILVALDDHSGWDDGLPEEAREYVAGRIRALVEKAVRHADERADGWGNIPAELRDEIRRSVSTVVDWRTVLRQFVGSLVRGQRVTTIKRINKRYPYIHPGTKRGYNAKLIVAIDESGSVDDSMLEMFFAELDSLTRRVDITLIHFDCGCGENDVYEWKRGMRPKLQRMRGGGTDFNAPTNFVNDPKNRGRWDGMLIMTDGQAGSPVPSRIKRGWVLGQGCKLAFEMPETQIFLSKDRPMAEAWR